MKQIAELLSVSLGTVSLVLNGKGDEMRISEETQRQIFDTAKALGYPLRKPMSGRKVIAIFLSVYEKVVTPANQVMLGAERGLREEGLPYDLLMCPFTYDHLREKYAYLSSEFCSGAIIFALSDRDMADLEKQNLDIPIVVYNRANNKFASVYVDNYNAGMEAARVFAAKGIKKAGLISSLNPNKSGAMRRLGYVDGCRQFGIEVREEQQLECFLSIDGGSEAAEQLLQQKELPQALFTTNDEIALGIFRKFREKKIAIPERVSILSYGGSSWNELITPSLTTIRLPIEEMSSACVQLLNTMLTTGEWIPISRIFPLKLEYRESCTEPEK